MHLMKKVQKGNLNVNFPAKYNDEVGLLGHQFNIMIIKIKDLIAHLKKTERRKTEVELEALQSQINPHFIYNTLETIKMTALVNDDDESAEMLTSLGRLLRYSTNRGSEMSTLKEELDHLADFMKLMDYRFPNRFILHYSDITGYENFPMIRLVFQPIVENAINHGFEMKQRQMSIHISFSVEEDGLHFEVRDSRKRNTRRDTGED